MQQRIHYSLCVIIPSMRCGTDFSFILASAKALAVLYHQQNTPRLPIKLHFCTCQKKNIWTTLLTFQNTILVTMPVKKQFHRGKISSNGGYSPNFVEHKDKTFRASIRRRTFLEFKLNKFVRLICVRYKASRDVESIRH